MNRSESCFQEGKVKNHYCPIPAFINSFSSEVSTIWLYQSLPLLLICLLPPSRLIPYIHCTWVTSLFSASWITSLLMQKTRPIQQPPSSLSHSASPAFTFAVLQQSTHRPSCQWEELHIRQLNSRIPLSDHSLWVFFLFYFHHICSLISLKKSQNL